MLSCFSNFETLNPVLGALSKVEIEDTEVDIGSDLSESK